MEIRLEAALARYVMTPRASIPGRESSVERSNDGSRPQTVGRVHVFFDHGSLYMNHNLRQH